MSRTPRRSLRGAIAVVTLLMAGACSGSSDRSRPESWSAPGLADSAGRAVVVPEPRPADGRVIEVDPVDGDDANAVREALDRAAPGGTVALSAGTYELGSVDAGDGSANLVVPSGVRLQGAGAGRTVLVSGLDGQDDSAVIRAKGVTDVVIAALTVTSTYDGPLGTDTESRSAGGGPMFGVYVGERGEVGSRRVLVEDIRVERFQRHGISVKASREVTIRGNEVADATSVGPGGAGYGIAIEGRADQRDTEAANDSRHHVVVGNVLDGEHLRHAILLQFPTHHNLIADNVVRGSRLDAIDLHGEGEYGNEVRGNRVTGGDRAGIALGNSGGSTHEHGATGEGNWVHDNLLIGNREGVLVILGTPGTLIERNRIVAGEGSRAGILLEDAPGTKLRDNRIEDRGVDGFADVDDEDR